MASNATVAHPAPAMKVNTYATNDIHDMAEYKRVPFWGATP